jgi:hypothetical protein
MKRLSVPRETTGSETQPECDGHVCDGFVVPCRDRGRVCRGWASTDPNPNLSPAPSQSMFRLSTLCIHISAREPPWLSPSSSAPRTTPPSRAGHGLNRLWLAALRGGGFLAVVFVEAPTLHVRVEHFEGSAAGVDLVVMRKIGEAFENAEQLLVLASASDLHIAGATLRAEWPEAPQLVAALGCRPHREAAQRPHQMLCLALAGLPRVLPEPVRDPGIPRTSAMPVRNTCGIYRSIFLRHRRCQPSFDVEQRPFARHVFPDGPQQKRVVDVVEQALDVKFKDPVVFPASLARDADGVKSRFSRPVTVGIWQEYRV